MRKVLISLFAMGAAGAAQAADLDYDYLRGADYDPPPSATIDWSGFYIGGHGGWTSNSLGYGNTARPIVASYLRQTVIENELGVSSLLSTPTSKRVNGTSFGAYAGYNVQYDDIVLGIEADYTHFGRAGSVSDQIGRTMVTSNGYFNTVNLASNSSTKVTDYASLRARVGYAFGNFMPYVTGGVAIGSAQVTDKVSIQVAGYDQTTYRANLAQGAGGTPAFVNNYGYSSFNQANPGAGILAAPYIFNRTKTKTVAGVAAGAGIEYAITPNILLRAEYQYVLFDAFEGHKANLNTIRGGAAIKF
ncbi:outer membrane protein [Methylobacterium komagatae]|uniref:Outer membrane protein n=1 Tax=Methylobacterium komagatae TaxID=374425 RepID=A0ABW2BFD6_9HYPH